jgi:hypothetical protein
VLDDAPEPTGREDDLTRRGRRAYAGAMADPDVTFATLDSEHGERFQTLRREPPES